MIKANIGSPLLLEERTGQDRVKVYSGKNRGGMEVERLRERLIRKSAGEKAEKNAKKEKT